MTTLAEAFPRLCARIHGAAAGPTRLEFAWGAPNDVAALLVLLTALQNGASSDLDELEAVSLAVYEDLGEQRARIDEPDHGAVLDFVQFWLAVSPLINSARRRRFSMARDWALRALVDDYAPTELGEAIHIERLPRFTEITDEPQAALVLPTVIEYADSLFYVARVTDDLFDLTRPLARYFNDLITQLTARSLSHQVVPDGLLDAAMSLLAWLHENDEETVGALARLLSDFESDERNSEDQRLRVGILLAGPAGSRTELPPGERALRLLQRHEQRLAGQERLGLLASAYVGRADELAAHLEDLFAAVDQYRRDLVNQGATAIDVLYDRGRLFRNYVGGPVLTLASGGDPRSALRLIGRWQGVDEIREDLVLLLSAVPQGSLWFWRDLVRPGSTDPGTFGQLISAANRALGLAITVSGVGEAGAPQPVRREGVPDLNHAVAYEQACEHHLGLTALSELASSGAHGGLVIVPGLPAPVCALAYRKTGIVWPIAASLRAPYADRAIRKVVIWPTAAALVDEEVEAVRSIFGSVGVDVEIVREAQTVDHFRQLYSRDDIDVLWLTSHGAQEPHRPEDSWLRINDEGDRLSLDELLALAQPTGARRRLLVLNACDSGAAATFGGLAEFGIGAVLAGPTQAVIAHLWPTHVTDAAGFGAVLASALADGAGYRDSFGIALAALLGGIQGLLGALESVPLTGQLRERLHGSAGRPTGILSFGTPTFLE